MNLQNKKVSIIVPVYNGEKFISRCLNDLIQQDYKNLEIIVVDDGSKDKTLQIINDFSKKDSRIVILTKKNGGTGSALNLGFSIASGDYQTWSSSDDIKYSNYISALVKVLDENINCEFAFSDHHEMHYNNPNIKNKFSDRISLNRRSEIMKDFIQITHQFCITGVCFMFSRELKEKIGNYHEIPGEDYIMGAKMGISTNVYYLNECLGAHVLHNDCLTLKQPGCTNQADIIAKKIIKNYLEFI